MVLTFVLVPLSIIGLIALLLSDRRDPQEVMNPYRKEGSP